MVTDFVLPQNFFKSNAFNVKTRRKQYKADIKTAMDDTLSILTGKREKIVKFISPIYLKLLKEYLKLIRKETNEKNKEESNDNESFKNKDEKKKKSKIYAYYLKLINNKYFQKLLGFVERIATTSFIQEIFTFLILLRYGIFQFFIPILLRAIKDAITELIRWIPIIIKFAFNILNNILPPLIYSILKEFIVQFLKLFGITFNTETEVFKKILMTISKILPYLVLLAYFLPKLDFIIKGLSFLFSIIPIIIKAIIFGVKIITFMLKVIVIVAKAIFVFFSSTVGIVVAIIAAVILLGYLIYKYWDAIKKWFSIAWDYLAEKWSQFSEWITKIWNNTLNWFNKKLKDIQKFFYNSILRPLKTIGSALYDFIIAPIKKILDVIRNVKSDIVDKISKILDKIFTALSPFFEKIHSFIIGITKIINDVLNYFRTVSDIGIGNWYFSWKAKDKEKLLKATTPASELLKDNKLDAVTLQQIQEEAKRKNISPETLLAAVISGLADKLDISTELVTALRKNNQVNIRYQTISAEFSKANTNKEK